MAKEKLRNIPLLEKWKLVLQALGVVALLGVAFFITDAANKAQVEAEYVSIAANILSDPNTNEELTEFAVDILVENSPVPIEDTLEEALREGDAVFPATGLPFEAGLEEPLIITQLLDSGPLPDSCTIIISPFRGDYPFLTAGPYDHHLDIGTPALGEYRAYEYFEAGGIADDGSWRIDDGWVSTNFVIPTADCFDPCGTQLHPMREGQYDEIQLGQEGTLRPVQRHALAHPRSQRRI